MADAIRDRGESIQHIGGMLKQPSQDRMAWANLPLDSVLERTEICPDHAFNSLDCTFQRR